MWILINSVSMLFSKEGTVFRKQYMKSFFLCQYKQSMGIQVLCKAKGLKLFGLADA